MAAAGALPATLLLVASGGLAAVAADVFAADSLHLLALIDATAHAWVSSTALLYPAELQALVAGTLMSDAAIVAGLAGWAAVTAAALQARSPRLLQALAASAGAYWAGGGRLWGSDPLLVDALKEAFQRARPSEHHHTFAFPSGHTTAASFVCGTLLFVLLPLALEALQQRQQQEKQQQAAKTRRSSSGIGSTGGSTALPSPVAWVLQQRWQVWGSAVALTACGRVVADKHWVSDTLAGACLGAALVGAVALVCGIGELGGSALPISEASRQEGGSRQR
ncbi:hypothetical protein ABPG75_005594 [Micractinium tetrahymenae]